MAYKIPETAREQKKGKRALRGPAESPKYAQKNKWGDKSGAEIHGLVEKKSRHYHPGKVLKTWFAKRDRALE